MKKKDEVTIFVSTSNKTYAFSLRVKTVEKSAKEAMAEESKSPPLKIVKGKDKITIGRITLNVRKKQ